MKRRVVVTGLGIVSSIGFGKEAFWNSLKAGRSGISRITAFDPAGEASAAAPIENIPAVADSGLSQFKSNELSQSSRPELSAARIIVSGGRGMGSGSR